MPPTSARARGIIASVPGTRRKQNGAIDAKSVREVIRMGRSLERVAATMASSGD